MSSSLFMADLWRSSPVYPPSLVAAQIYRGAAAPPLGASVQNQREPSWFRSGPRIATSLANKRSEEAATGSGSEEADGREPNRRDRLGMLGTFG